MGKIKLKKYMKRDKNKINKELKILNQIQKIRTKNNKNWIYGTIIKTKRSS